MRHIGVLLLSTVLFVAGVAGGHAFGCASSVQDDDGPTATTTSTTGSGGAAGAGGSQGGTAGEGGQPTGGAAPTCLDLGGTVLALDEIFLGDTDWNHSPSITAWEQYGFNLDGLTTTGGDLTGHCQPAGGAMPSHLDDGDAGIDNAWGKNVLPIFVGLVPDLADQVNDNLNSGMFTLLMLFEQLGSEPDQDPIVTKLYGGAPLGAVPAWDGSDCWPVVQEQLEDPADITSASTVFANSSLVGDVWSSGSSGTVILPFNFGFVVQDVTIHHARLRMQMAPSHQGAALGVIGGVLDTAEVIEIVRDILGSIDPNLCQGTTFDSIATQLLQASDIMADGTQNPSAVCDGISVGIGFTMLFAGIEGIADPAPAPPDPCP